METNNAPPQDANRKNFMPAAVSIIVLIIVLIGGFLILRQTQKPPSELSQDQTNDSQSIAPAQEQGLGAEVFDQAQNPVGENLPNTNPFSDTKINPFE